MIEAGLIVSRFVHFAAVLMLFGAAAFPLYAYKDGEGKEPFEALATRLSPVLFAAAAIASLSAAAWLCFTAANMSGALANAISPAILSLVIEQTDFGRVWIWRIGLSAVLIVLFYLKTRNETFTLLRIAGAALLLTSLGSVGHPAATPGMLGTIHVAVDSLHLLAASAWIGGLLPLMLMLANPEVSSAAASDILGRFSRFAMLAVAALAASGVANGLLEFESIAALFGTTYGRVLIVKVLLFAGMLHFAAANRFKLMPAFARAEDAGPARRTLNRNIAAELILGALVLAAAAFLGTLSPSAD